MLTHRKDELRRVAYPVEKVSNLAVQNCDVMFSFITGANGCYEVFQDKGCIANNVMEWGSKLIMI